MLLALVQQEQWRQVYGPYLASRGTYLLCPTDPGQREPDISTDPSVLEKNEDAGFGRNYSRRRA